MQHAFLTGSFVKYIRELPGYFNIKATQLYLLVARQKSDHSLQRFAAMLANLVTIGRRVVSINIGPDE